MKVKEEELSVFWCSLLHELIFAEIEKGGVCQYLEEISKKVYMFPDGTRKKPSYGTLIRKYYQYKKGGFKSLIRKSRNDKGKIRKVSKELVDKAIELKKEQPFRSDDGINRILALKYNKTIPKSTLYKHLKEAGATKIKLGISKKKVRKRFTKKNTHDLWIGDFEDAPYVLSGNEVVPTYLSLFIDCHSKYIVEGKILLQT